MRVAIIGGGPAGMMASVRTSENKGNEVFLFEKNEKLGKKLFITGKGRCNVTNACDTFLLKNYIMRNQKFLLSSLSKFSNKDLIKFLEINNCKIKVERGLRVFPKSDKSFSITDCFKRVMRENGVSVFLDSEVIDIICDKDNDTSRDNKKRSHIVKEIQFKNLRNNKISKIEVDRVIVATGGISYKSTGSTGDGYKFAKKFGIKICDQVPVLVPMGVSGDFSLLNGLLLKNIKAKFFINNRLLYESLGDVEFYKFGITGPIILSASSHLFDENNLIINDINSDEFFLKNKILLSIDLKPALLSKQLDDRLIREIEKLKGNDLVDLLLIKLLPRQLVAFFKKIIFEDENFTINKMNKVYRKKILNLLKNFEIEIVSGRGFNEAIVTRGGVDCDELNPKTMESKKVKGLYFAGEVVDVDCLTGGFNITAATSMGYVAGSDLK